MYVCYWWTLWFSSYYLKNILPLFYVDNHWQCFIFKFLCEHLLTSTWLSFRAICLDLFGPAWLVLLCHIQPSGSTEMGNSAPFHHSHPRSPFLSSLPCSIRRVYLLILDILVLLFLLPLTSFHIFLFSSLALLLQTRLGTVSWLGSWRPPWLLPTSLLATLHPPLQINVAPS